MLIFYQFVPLLFHNLLNLLIFKDSQQFSDNTNRFPYIQ